MVAACDEVKLLALMRGLKRAQIRVHRERRIDRLIARGTSATL
jgi:hypothetical protein